MPRVKNTTLRLVAIRLRKHDIAVAKRLSRAQAIPYQHIVRSWVAVGAAKISRALTDERSGGTRT